jgi:hypothetical protein
MRLYYRCLLGLLIVIFSGCSGGYDETTGLFEGEGILVSFPLGWKKAETLPNTILCVESSDKSAQLILVVQELPGAITYESYIKRVASNQRRLARAREQDSGLIKIGDQESHWSIKTVPAGAVEYTTITYFVLHGRKVYSIMGKTESKDFSRWETAFDEVAKTVSFN